MKQKQVKAAPKSAKQTNAKKATLSKKAVAAAVKEVEEEVVVKKVLATKKPAIKKAAKVQKKKVVEEVIESPEEEEEDDEVEQDIEEEEDDEEPMDEEAVDDEADEEQEDEEKEDDEQEDDEQEDDEQEDEEEENDEEEDDEDEENDEEEDDDEAPTEAPVDEEPTIPSKVKSGRIPPTFPIERIVNVTRLPSKCKKIDIVQAFAKYGAIQQVYIETKLNGTYANVAFKTAEAAQKAVLEANKKVKIHDCIIWVALKKPRKEKKTEETKPAKERFNYSECFDRSVGVKYLKPDTTEDQIKEHFAACGEIENVKIALNKIKSVANAYVTFTDKKALPAAKKLHHTVLNKAKIGVFENSRTAQRDPKLTIILRNKQDLESIEGEKVEKIFAKCGEIVNVDIMRSKNILAIVSFKDEEAVQKAFKMNGKTEQGIELDIGECLQDPKKLTIYVTNLAAGCTERDLTAVFSKAGEISTIFLKPTFAVISFKDTDGFCKSFLYNETKIRNKFIFVQPHSPLKKKFNKANTPKLNPFNNKRPAQNGSGFVMKPKKIKKH